MPPLTLRPPIGLGGHAEELREARIRIEVGVEGLLVVPVVALLLFAPLVFSSIALARALSALAAGSVRKLLGIQPLLPHDVGLLLLPL